MKRFSKSITCLTISGSIAPVFAATNTSVNKQTTSTADDLELDNLSDEELENFIEIINNLSDEELEEYLNKILDEDYENNVYIQSRGIASSVLKVFKNWVKKSSKVLLKGLEAYIAKYPSLKGIASALNYISDADESIDNAIYNVVNKLIPNASEKDKKSITRIIRILSPI